MVSCILPSWPQALLSPEDVVLSDELNHASIIDGIRLCKAHKVRYRHLDMADLESKLQEAQVGEGAPDPFRLSMEGGGNWRGGLLPAGARKLGSVEEKAHDQCSADSQVPAGQCLWWEASGQIWCRHWAKSVAQRTKQGRGNQVLVPCVHSMLGTGS